VTVRRIALISSSFHPYPGGVEEHVRNVARELLALGHEVAVWTVDRGEHLGRAVVDGVEVRYLPAPLPAARPGPALRFLRDLPVAWSAWMRAFRDFRPDVLNVQCFGPNGAYALLLHHRTRVPLVVSSHGETLADAHLFDDSLILSRALSASLRRAALVTGCSNVVLEDLRSRFGARDGQVIPNGVDLDEAGRVAMGREGVPPASVPTVLAVGRIVPVKGFDLLIEAFAQVPTTVPARLVVVGDGPEVRVLEELVVTHGLADRVLLAGHLDRPALLASMDSADLVVVPSRFEAFGIVILEAWRAGRPVVATNRGGPAEIVTDGVDGLLVDPEDVEGLAGAMTELLLDPALRHRLGESGRARVRDFTWRRTALAYADDFESTLPSSSFRPAQSG